MAKHTLGKSKFIELKDGRKLHYRTRGSGEPTVVFEAGLGFSSAIWGLVLPSVAEQTSTVAYDRAGTGKSTWDSSDRTLDRIADDLEELLNHLTGPLILVGHSWGGVIIRRMASRGTADIRALVLVDQADERNPDYFTKAIPQRNGLVKTAVLWVMHTIGLPKAGLNVLQDMPTDCRREIMWRDISIRGAALGEAEQQEILPGLKLMSEADDRLEGIKVSVISGTSPEGLKDEHRQEMVDAHRDTAEALDRSTFVEAPNSGHFVPMTDAKIVAEEILRLVTEQRSPTEASN